MSYSFSFEQPGHPNDSYAMNIFQMSIMRDVMREVKAFREQGFSPNWTILPDGVTHDLFSSNSNQLVTPDACRLIAERLRAGLADGTVFNTLSFFDDAPRGAEGEAWVAEWADYNERAANAGGYRV